MAWTAPRTWVVAEVVTAALMNTHIRDNLNYLKGNAGAVAISDELQSVVAAGGTLTAQGTNNSAFGRLKLLGKTGGGADVDWRLISNGTAGSELGFFEAATERMRIATGGNVGIGTTDPRGKNPCQWRGRERPLFV